MGMRLEELRADRDGTVRGDLAQHVLTAAGSLIQVRKCYTPSTMIGANSFACQSGIDSYGLCMGHDSLPAATSIIELLVTDTHWDWTCHSSNIWAATCSCMQNLHCACNRRQPRGRIDRFRPIPGPRVRLAMLQLRCSNFNALPGRPSGAVPCFESGLQPLFGQSTLGALAPFGFEACSHNFLQKVSVWLWLTPAGGGERSGRDPGGEGA